MKGVAAVYPKLDEGLGKPINLEQRINMCRTENMKAEAWKYESDGFPTYRLKWQKVGSLHRRFRGCNEQVRATKLPYGTDDYVNLELYLAWRGNGLPIETPAVRQ